ncbi:MAG: hypothetical protein KAI26_03410 [Nanoarchaeota archaeon]|nr:hypothetical protein [Nanoarchaeota archaeon]
MNIFKKLWKKKGVSPLIATVLLIAFAVSLGAVVMNWGRGYVETTMTQADVQSAEKISCSMDTSIGVVQVGDKQRLCIDDAATNATLNFTLINTGSATLQGVQILVIPVSGAPPDPVEVGSETPKSGMMYAGTILSGNRSTIDQIEIAPIILVKGVKVVCLEHSIKRLPTEIGEC